MEKMENRSKEGYIPDGVKLFSIHRVEPSTINKKEVYLLSTSLGGFLYTL